MRGTMYDRNGIALAETVPVTTLTVDRQQLSAAERATLQVNLGRLLGKDAAAIDRLIDNTQYESFVPVPVAKNVSLETAVDVMEHRDLYPEVSVTRTAERRYPARLPGRRPPRLRGADQRRRARRPPAATTTRAPTRSGRPASSRCSNRSSEASRARTRSRSTTRAVRSTSSTVKQPRAGHDVRLTVDLPTQHIAEESLTQGMDGARTLVDPDNGNYYPANAGAVVVLDARTGSVVAMASNPSFDPNDFISGNADKYFQDPNKPLINRALNAYAPGSTFKTITSIAMLQSGLFEGGAGYTWSDYPDGCFHFGNDEERCNAGDAVLGTVDLPAALTVSSDVYFYKVGNEFWNAYRDEGQAKEGCTGCDLAGDKLTDAEHPVGNAIQHTASTYGFGEQTGIGLGDQAGVIPNHEYRVKLNPDDVDNQFWRRGDSASLAVGQGDVLVTPLQLAERVRRVRQRRHAVPAAAGRRGHREQRRPPARPARADRAPPSIRW